jgi:hypothetical protein
MCGGTVGTVAGMADSWDLVPGDYLTRKERSARFGGATMGGIQPSARTPNVFVYSDPTEGHQNGYIFDGWSADRTVFLYTGEGRTGDQSMLGGNNQILHHRAHNRVLRLFVADGKIKGSGTKNQLYIGAFELDRDVPYVQELAPDADRIERTVIVFRLRPIEDPLVRDIDASETGDVQPKTEAQLVGLEMVTRSSYKRASQEEAIAAKREDDLVKRYASSMGAAGADLRRWKVRPAGTLLTLYTDPYHEVSRELYEAKASSKRENIRMALGQILDYERWISPQPLKRTVLVPSRPSLDLIELLHSYGVGVVFEESDGNFERLDPLV